jgi:DNA-binding beta-propeller fold protein YncE
MKHIVSLITAVLFFSTVSAAQSFYLDKTITLGGEGGWDYLTYDSNDHRLFITRGTHVMVVDPVSGTTLGEIPATEGVHGVALAHDLGRGFTSNGRSSTVTIFGLETLKPLTTVKVGDTPDAIVYDSYSHRVFTFNARGKDATAVDAASGKVLGSVALNGEPEFAVADGKGTIFANIADLHQIVAFDTARLSVLHTWTIDGCEEPTGLALDVEHHRLFAGCGNKKLAVVDSHSGRLVATLPIGAGVDGTAFDSTLQTVFSSNGSGTLTVIRELSPDKFEVLQGLPTSRGARTLALDPVLHAVYLVTAKVAPDSPPSGRPKYEPGTFSLLIVKSK